MLGKILCLLNICDMAQKKAPHGGALKSIRLNPNSLVLPQVQLQLLQLLCLLVSQIQNYYLKPQ